MATKIIVVDLRDIIIKKLSRRGGICLNEIEPHLLSEEIIFSTDELTGVLERMRRRGEISIKIGGFFKKNKELDVVVNVHLREDLIKEDLILKTIEHHEGC
ncbi:hypothetical protein KKA27_01490 [Patescibacteria group bacterium]|nr:hypothetical protein [Patescibacteria group bacterium]MBU2633175.1 hypothetical protein [Patescibacteria group bacterium]